MISESTINKVRNLPIEDILKPYVRFSRKGLTLMGLCPFHSERTGSFAITPSKNLFHCFSCNRGGDGIAFIMEKEKGGPHVPIADRLADPHRSPPAKGFH